MLMIHPGGSRRRVNGDSFFIGALDGSFVLQMPLAPALFSLTAIPSAFALGPTRCGAKRRTPMASCPTALREGSTPSSYGEIIM